jgi:hypothetical protein
VMDLFGLHPRDHNYPVRGEDYKQRSAPPAPAVGVRPVFGLLFSQGDQVMVVAGMHAGGLTPIRVNGFGRSSRWA